MPKDGQALCRELEESCSAAHRVLVEERSTCMAQQIRTAAVPRAEVFVICGAPNFASLVVALQRPPREGGADELARLARRFVPVWPLYVLGYVVVPGALAAYVLGSVWESFIAPALDFEQAGDPAAGALPVPRRA
mmetsp:Transcript_43164/g.122061  ORF Transcript_43164/g.122061 Transcript_43164/m.122061 type:complete len:135 (-) Transcript_43164:25-429(-)